MPLPSDPWHALGADEALRRSGGDAVGGLSDDEVSRRRAAHGHNVLPEPPPRDTRSGHNVAD